MTRIIEISSDTLYLSPIVIDTSETIIIKKNISLRCEQLIVKDKGTLLVGSNCVIHGDLVLQKGAIVKIDGNTLMPWNLFGNLTTSNFTLPGIVSIRSLQNDFGDHTPTTYKLV